MIEVLSAPDVISVDLQGQAPAGAASARAYWSRTRGLLFTADHLPNPGPGRVYQLWVVTAKAPVSAGLLTVGQSGNATLLTSMPADLAAPVAVAVTIEPAGGMPSPTGPKVLVGLTKKT
jgi:anti-sigma-K factor RskA